jgi:hypothetical protein
MHSFAHSQVNRSCVLVCKAWFSLEAKPTNAMTTKAVAAMLSEEEMHIYFVCLLFPFYKIVPAHMRFSLRSAVVFTNCHCF